MRSMTTLIIGLLFIFNVVNGLPIRVSLLELESSSTNVSERNDLDWRWQRTGFHFQPTKNWMNDPNGPLVYKGIYHLFYQYNPFAAVWGNITWGHAVSKDLIHWEYLEMSLEGDHWYDIKGVWSGSATFVKGVPVMLYTGWTNESAQVQCKAVPADPSDPLLRRWIKTDNNPILVAPEGINSSQFRDPTTAWKNKHEWRMAVGSKQQVNNTGIVLQYRSSDFASWELLNTTLHQGAGSGMWECPDFFPVPTKGRHGVANYRGKNLKYVVKVSLDEKRWDQYVVGSYDQNREVFVPKIPSLDIGQTETFRYDYGIYYASKSFFDQEKTRRILLGWIGEADTAAADVTKGWSSLQAIPRQVWLDESTGHSLIQLPVQELESLRKDTIAKKEMYLGTKQVVEVHAGDLSEADIEVTFDTYDMSVEHGYSGGVDTNIPSTSFLSPVVNLLSYCNETFPSAEKIIGPFGLHVLATPDLQERTSIFFKLYKFKDGWKTAVCNDLTRSTLAADAIKAVYGTLLTITESENHELSLRVIVDHSIVETFAQGGKACITARSYPLLGDDNTARLFLFNNGTIPVKMKSLKVHRMGRIQIRDFNGQF